MKPIRKTILTGLAIVLTALAASFLLAPFMPAAVDWTTTFRPATLALLAGESPYGRFYLSHAPWGLVMIIPLALLPEAVGRVMGVFCGLASYMYVAHRLGAKKISIAFLLISPLVMHVLLNGNIEWLAILGFVMPPNLGYSLFRSNHRSGLPLLRFGWWKLGVKADGNKL